MITLEQIVTEIEWLIEDRDIDFDMGMEILRRLGVGEKMRSSASTSMYLDDTRGMSPLQIRDKVNGFHKD